MQCISQHKILVYGPRIKAEGGGGAIVNFERGLLMRYKHFRGIHGGISQEGCKRLNTDSEWKGIAHYVVILHISGSLAVSACMLIALEHANKTKQHI
jgi:hypothetical protein